MFTQELILKQKLTYWKTNIVHTQHTLNYLVNKTSLLIFI